jgi:hypothetical protein
MKNSSEPFRAFLGAILSVHKGIPVPASALNTDMGPFITVTEEDGNGHLPEDDTNDGTGPYKYSSTSTIIPKVPMTCSQTATSGQAPGPGLLVRPIPSGFLSAHLSTHRLLAPSYTLLNPSKYGCTFSHCPTTTLFLQFLPRTEIGNDGYG